MQWTFSPEDVVNGTADYTLDEFRQDLYAEVCDNFPEYDEDRRAFMFRLAYDVCYCSAAHQGLDRMREYCAAHGLPIDRDYLELIRKSNEDNIAMLKAIFARTVSRFVGEGLSSEEALRKLDAIHAEAVTRPPTGD